LSTGSQEEYILPSNNGTAASGRFPPGLPPDDDRAKGDGRGEGESVGGKAEGASLGSGSTQTEPVAGPLMMSARKYSGAW